MSGHPEEKKETKRSFVSEEDAEKMTAENTANEILSRSPLDRLVLAKEQEVMELKKIREGVERLVEVFTNAKPKSITTKNENNRIVPPQTPKPETTQSDGASDTESAQLLFTKELADLLVFTNEGDSFKIKPKQYLGSENFSKVSSAVREIGGQYVSAGRDSHFKIPKSAIKEEQKTTQPKPQPQNQAKLPTSTPESAPTSNPIAEKIKRIMEHLGPELTTMLVFDTEESSNFIKVKPKQYLGQDNFAKISQVLKENGGQYVSAGKDSHFKIPKLV